MINPNIKTLADLPFEIARRFPDRTVLRHSLGDAFIDTSGHEFLERVRNLSLGLGELGLAAGDRVAVVAETRPEWCITDFAVLTAAGVTVPIYPTLTIRQVGHILNDCGAKLAVVSDRAQVEKIAALRTQLSGLATVVVMDASTGRWPEGVMTLAEVATRGHQRLMIDSAGERLFRDVGVVAEGEQYLALPLQFLHEVELEVGAARHVEYLEQGDQGDMVLLRAVGTDEVCRSVE